MKDNQFIPVQWIVESVQRYQETGEIDLEASVDLEECEYHLMINNHLN